MGTYPGFSLLVSFILALAPFVADAQIRDPTSEEVQTQDFTPADEIVSFGPGTPFNQFVQTIGPLYQRATGKVLVDPTGRLDAIGFYVTGLPYRDALGLVLARAGLTIRETDRYSIIEPEGLQPATLAAAAVAELDAPTADDREIRIDALIFELNLNRVREIGTDWGSIFGESTDSQEQGQQGQSEERFRLFLRTETVFDAIAAIIDGPDRIDLAELNRLFRLLETNGVGRTLSTPSIVVRSKQEGRFQSGSDIPVTLRDFAGNTVQQFISTGVIIEARPQLIVDEDENGVPVQFIHLLVDVEQSVGRVSNAGVTVDKNQGATDLLFADGEQVVLGGLYSTEESMSHKGIPILKDIPLLGYLFGVRRRSTTERELIIVLKASLLDPIPERVARPRPINLLEEERRDRGVRLNRTQEGLGQDTRLPED